MLVFTSKGKSEDIIVLVATGRVKVLSISRLLAAKFFLLWQQPMPALTAPVLPAPKPRICHLFNARDGPCCTYRQHKLPTSAHNAEGLTLALYVADRPTEVQKHLEGTVQQEVTQE